MPFDSAANVQSIRWPIFGSGIERHADIAKGAFGIEPIGAKAAAAQAAHQAAMGDLRRDGNGPSIAIRKLPRDRVGIGRWVPPWPHRLRPRRVAIATLFRMKGGNQRKSMAARAGSPGGLQIARAIGPIRSIREHRTTGVQQELGARGLHHILPKHGPRLCAWLVPAYYEPGDRQPSASDLRPQAVLRSGSDAAGQCSGFPGAGVTE